MQDELEKCNMFENLAKNNNEKDTSYAIRMSKNKLQYPKYFIKNETAFKAITVNKSNTLRLQQVYKDENTISKSVKIKYLVEGKCSGFKIHPSNEYL